MTKKEQIFLDVLKTLDFKSVVSCYINTHTAYSMNDIDFLPFDQYEIPEDFDEFIEFLGNKIDNLKIINS